MLNEAVTLVALIRERQLILGDRYFLGVPTREVRTFDWFVKGMALS